MIVTINDVTFHGRYVPAEPMVMYYKDGSGHPGSPAEFEIEKIEGDNLKLIQLIENNIPELRKVDLLDDLSVLIATKIQADETIM
jgi:hypothetical protein